MSRRPRNTWDDLDTIKAADCLVLLDYVASNHEDDQSLRSLVEACNIPYSSLRDIIDEAERGPDQGGPSLLEMVGAKYGFVFKINRKWRDHDGHKRKWIIDAVSTGMENPDRWGIY